MIVKLGGCKFMECAKCRFQFCWLCLSEFYTQYHYYESLCPLRVVPIYSMIAIVLFIIDLKLMFMFPSVYYLHVMTVSNLLLFLLVVMMTFSLIMTLKNSYYLCYDIYKVYYFKKRQEIFRDYRSV